MKFFVNTPDNKDWYQASPFLVRSDNVLLSYLDFDAFPFVITNDNVYVGGYGAEHSDVETHYKSQIKPGSIEWEGRYWKHEDAIALWAFYSEEDNSCKDAMSRLIKAFRTRFGIDIRTTRLFMDFCVASNSQHDFVSFMVEMTVSEYMSLNIPQGRSEKQAEFFWGIMNKENKLQSDDTPSNIAPNGMNTKDVWRHYERVGESKIPKGAIRLTEEDLKYIINGVLKEYHQGQQLMLPFDGNDEPYNYMQFIEWLEEHGKYGKLPAEPGSMDKIMADPERMYDVGLCGFYYYGSGGEWDSEGYYEFLEEFLRNNPQALQEGYTLDELFDRISDVESTKDFLTPKGAEAWRNAIIAKGKSDMFWWVNNKIQFNGDGLIYCERMIQMEKPLERYHSGEEYGNKDYYSTLESTYDGVGVYWSYAAGGGAVYFNMAQAPQEVLLKGWVSPNSVDWGTTISLESMDEQELRLIGGDIVQLDAVEMWTEHGNINLLTKGSLLVEI